MPVRVEVEVEASPGSKVTVSLLKPVWFTSVSVPPPGIAMAGASPSHQQARNRFIGGREPPRGTGRGTSSDRHRRI
ncbi:hypothetical protein llg_24400 [Luteolibacter sp. LG18]|nr:hypothetical protein llg_24400 [Luteolibacter sp. LG18]